MYIDENDNRTPRERVDDSFLRRILEDGEPSAPHLGARRESAVEGMPCHPQMVEGCHQLVNFPLGMVYSPVQVWRNAYDLETALARGTLFRELDMPWEVDAPTGRKGGFCCD